MLLSLALHCIVLFCIALHCIALYSNVLYCSNGKLENGKLVCETSKRDNLGWQFGMWMLEWKMKT